MDTGQWRDCLNLLKVLADENRLTMLNLMAQDEQNVSGMAGVLALSEPTISHHVSKLHGAGLLHLRMAGNQRFYRLNEKRLNQFKRYVAEIELPPTQEAESTSDNTWIEALDWDEEDKKILIDHTHDGKLVKLPTKEKKWLVILRWLAGLFEPGRRYSEKEVNAVILGIHSDYATLRRSLVEYGFMRRERGGGDYWLTPVETTEEQV